MISAASTTGRTKPNSKEARITNGEFCVAVHALVYLDHKACFLTSEALAENICTNPARVRKVMARLKKAGLVSTRAGADGGYLFTGDAAGITLNRIGEALDVRYIQGGWRSGDPDMECLVSSGMANVMDGLTEELEIRCREALAAITLADIERRIFDPQKGTQI